MTLKEKYTIKNKKRAKQFIFFYSFLVIFFILYSSFARYEQASEGYMKATIANWKIALNGEELTSDNNTIENKITLIPTTNIDENEPTKIKTGQSGYFDIEIDPTDTEVSFWYQITLDLTNIPSNLNITSYSINDGATSDLPDTNLVSSTVSLEGKNIFTSSDKQTIKFFWNWPSGDYEEGEYTINANIEVKQVL